MNKKELLDYLSEKIRITAPVASAQENVNQAEWNLTRPKENSKMTLGSERKLT